METISLDSLDAFYVGPWSFDVFFIGFDSHAEKAIRIANQLIDEGYSIHIDTLKKSEKNQLKNAIKMNASFYLRCNELIELKNLSSKEECVINNITDLKKFIKS